MRERHVEPGLPFRVADRTPIREYVGTGGHRHGGAMRETRWTGRSCVLCWFPVPPTPQSHHRRFPLGFGLWAALVGVLRGFLAVLCETLLYLGVRHREEFVREVAERGVFLRRTSHMSPMIARVLALTIALSVTVAGSQPPAPAPPVASQKQQPAGSSKAQPPDPNSGMSPAPPATSNLTVSPQSQTVAPKPSNQGNKEPSEDWRIVLFTATLTVVAILQWIAMLRQSKHMRDGLAQNERQIAINMLALKATTLAAEAATASATVAHDTLHTVERAHIGFGQFSIERETFPQKFSIAIKNTGRTMAKRVECKIKLVALEELPNTPDYTNAIEYKWPSVGPDVGFNMNIGRADPFINEYFSTPKDGPAPSRVLYLYSLATYWDEFGREHATQVGRYQEWGTKTFPFIDKEEYNHSH